jgi:hypothetical protein
MLIQFMTSSASGTERQRHIELNEYNRKIDSKLTSTQKNKEKAACLY